MGKDIIKIATNTADQKQWHKYFLSKDTELGAESNNLLNGIKTHLGRGYKKVGYRKLRWFFEGDQWDFVPEGGQKMRVYNYCRNVVYNYTAFMTSEPLDVDVPPFDITDEIEVLRAEEKEKVLKEVLRDNNFDTILEAAAQNGSLLGDSIILGPFHDEENDRITMFNVKKPENIRIIWSDDSFSEVFGFIHHYYVTPEKAYAMFPEAQKLDIVLDEIDISDTPSSAEQNRRTSGGSADAPRRMVKILDCWTKDIHLLMVGNKDLRFEENDLEFIPLIHVANNPHPIDPWGTSDFEDMLDAQTELNERTSDMSEIISQTAFPWIFGKNIDPVEVQSGKLNLIDLGDEAELMPDPRSGNPGVLDNEISRRTSSIYQLSGLNENIFGGQGVRAVTGRALSVLMQTVNNRIKGRQQRWTNVLQVLFENIFKIIEKKYPNGKELVGGYYKTDIFFPSTIIRNITDELNKFNAKVQSQETTQKNLGVPSPKDEKKLMKEELQDQIMMVELSRNPQLQLQIHEMLKQQVAQKVAGNKPMLSEDENMEEQPVSAGGAPQQSSESMEGAVNQVNQRAGTSVAREAKEE